MFQIAKALAGMAALPNIGATTAEMLRFETQGISLMNGHKIGPGEKHIAQLHRDIYSKRHRKAFTFPAK